MRRERMTNPKCLGGSFPDTFNAKSADSTGLKMNRITRAVSFDHLVSAQQERLGDFEVEGLCGCQIDDEIEFSRLLDG
jgi:hypothetical protein